MVWMGGFSVHMKGTQSVDIKIAVSFTNSNTSFQSSNHWYVTVIWQVIIYSVVQLSFKSWKTNYNPVLMVN